jgi:hypothetical protein
VFEQTVELAPKCRKSCCPVKKPYEASDAQVQAATHVQKNIDAVDLLQADTQMFTLDTQVLALQLTSLGI